MSVKDIKSISRRIRKISGRVDIAAGVPSIGAGSGFTLVDVAPGQVKVVLNKPSKSILCALACPIESTDATGFYAKVDAKTEASDVTFAIYQADAVDGVLVDNVGFYFEITVKDVSN